MRCAILYEDFFVFSNEIYRRGWKERRKKNHTETDVLHVQDKHHERQKKKDVYVCMYV